MSSQKLHEYGNMDNYMAQGGEMGLEPDPDSQTDLYDERVTSIVDQFFQQTSDQRLMYIECFKHLLEKKLQR